MAEPMQRCNWSMKDVLYEVLHSVHMLSDWPKGKDLAKLQLRYYIVYVCLHSSSMGCSFAGMQKVNERMYFMRS